MIENALYTLIIIGTLCVMWVDLIDKSHNTQANQQIITENQKRIETKIDSLFKIRSYEQTRTYKNDTIRH